MLKPCTGAALLAVLDRIPCLAGPGRRVEELSGGLTNRNLKVTTDDGVYVARCTQGDPELLGIDRDYEHLNTVAAWHAGVGAPVVDYRPDLGVLVIGFVDGRTYEDADLVQPGALSRVATAVRTLHAGPRFTGDFDMFARQRAFLDVIADHDLRLPPEYPAYADRFAEVGAALRVRPVPSVPCNNDLLAANIVDDGDRIWLIDYEYAGNNDPAFELGNTAAECGLERDQVTELVTAYAGGRTWPGLLARVRVQTLVSRYGWALWGYIQAATSPLDFDFTAWGDERLDAAAQIFDGPELDSLLQQLVDGGRPPTSDPRCEDRSPDG